MWLESSWVPLARTDCQRLAQVYHLLTVCFYHQSSPQCQICTCFFGFCVFFKLYKLLVCLKARTLRTDNNRLRFVKIPVPTASRHKPLALRMLFAPCVQNHPGGVTSTPRIHHAAYNYKKTVFVAPSAPATIHLDDFARGIQEGDFFSLLVLHLISVYAQFLFSSTWRSLSFPPTIKTLGTIRRVKRGERERRGGKKK